MTLFKLICDNKETVVQITPAQALGLEVLLNKSAHGKMWRGLGNVLYEWRQDPLYFCTYVPMEHHITPEQMTWVLENLPLV